MELETEKINEELIDHTLIVDKYITTNIKIPKVMNILDFSAIMDKVSKISKAGGSSFEMSIMPSKIKNPTKMSYHPRPGFAVFTDDMSKFIVSEKEKGTDYFNLVVNFNAKFGTKFTEKQIIAKVGNLRANNKYDYYKRL